MAALALDAVEHGLTVKATRREGHEGDRVRPSTRSIPALEPACGFREACPAIAAGCRLLDDNDVELAATVAPGQVAAQPGADVETDLLVALGELAEKPGHGTAEDIFRKPDMNGRRTGRIAQCGCCLVLERHDPTGISKEAFACGRGANGACVPIHQGLPNGFLKPGQLLTQGRLGHVQALSCPSKASGFDDCNKGPQQAWVEHRRLVGALQLPFNKSIIP